MPKSKGVFQSFQGLYEQVQDLGKGRFAHLYKAKEKKFPHRQVALKVIALSRTDEKSLSLLKREFEILKNLSHPGIVKVYDFGILSKSRLAYVAEEYLDGKETPHGKVDESTLIQWMGMLLRALQYLHQYRVYHGDIKPENVVVLKTGEIKFVDFGFAVGKSEEGGDGLKEIAGTLRYLAPERLGGAPSSRGSDLYALGVLLYEWAAGSPPFEEKESSKLIPKIMSEMPPSPLKFNPSLSPSIADLILSLLQKNPLDRPHQANDLLRELNARLNLSIPLEGQGRSELWWSLAGTIGRESLLEDLVKENQGARTVIVSGERGMGKSPFLSVLFSKLQLKGKNPFRLDVRQGPPITDLKTLFPSGIPPFLLIDDFDLLPPSIQELLVKKARGHGHLLWVWTTSGGKPIDAKRNLFLDSYSLSPLEESQVGEFVIRCFGLKSYDENFVSRLQSLTRGLPGNLLKGMTLLTEEALDPLGPVAPQLAKISPDDFLRLDPLTGISLKTKTSLKDSRARLIEQTKQELLKNPKEKKTRLLLANLWSETGEYQAILKEIKFEEDPILYLNALNRVGRFEEVIDLCGRLKIGGENAAEKVNRLNQEGMALYFLDKKEESVAAFREAVSLCEGEKNQEKLAVSLNNLANVLSHGKTPLKAIPLYEESLRCAKKALDPFSEGRSYANLGHLYHLLQDYGHALEYYYAGFNQYRRIGFLGEMVPIKANLGGLFMELGAYPQAEEAILESLRLSMEREMMYQVHYAYFLYGDLMRRKRQWEKAGECYEKAKEGFEKLNAREDLKRVALDQLQMALSLKHWEEAKNLLEKLKGESLFGGMKAQWNFLNAKYLLMTQLNFSEVELLLKEALRIFESLNRSDEQLLTLFFLYSFYTRFHKEAQALEIKTKVGTFVRAAKARIPREYWQDYQRLIPPWV